MRITHDQMFGMRFNYRLQMTDRELAALRKAQAILDEARESLREYMGVHEFEGSAYYTYDVYDLLDHGPEGLPVMEPDYYSEGKR